MRPLCVDLDDTFLKTDSLVELLIAVLKENPIRIFAIIVHLFQGKASFKNFLLNYQYFDIDSLPVQEKLLIVMQNEVKNGRSMILVTGAHQSIADRIREKYPLFSEAYGTSDTENLTGENKANFLIRRFGKEGFDYAGNAPSDLKVWQFAHEGWIVSHNSRFIAKVLKKFPNKRLQIIKIQKNSKQQIINLIRPSQWAKNLLIFVPLLLAQDWNKKILIQATKCFFAFSTLSSFVYILNDLLDVSNDRKHPTKSMRPFASGAVSLEMGLFLSLVFFFLYVFLALWLPPSFSVISVVYLVLNLLYSLKLKKILVLDAFVLASFYSLRLLGGSAAIDVKTSHWLIIFSTFFFLSLGFLKRYTDLLFVSQKSGQFQLDGRNYQLEDTQLLVTAGVASGFVSILVFAQYIYGPESLHYYPQSQFLWGVLFCMMYWITKIWFKASRGLVHDDPVKYALKDRESIILGITTLIFIIMAAWK